ncbi:MAG: PLP-dependent aminotransferase family protein [Kineosporiaceae bacterium]|nr:PLP-dependent aminotransferase family protein [Aeromicrobium sp.]
MNVLLSASRLRELLGELSFDGPAYRELSDRIRLLILDGRLSHGTRLPSERELCIALGLSRTTVSRVYAELRDSGFLESRRGSGSVIRVPYVASSTSALIAHDTGETSVSLTYAASAAPAGIGRAFSAAMHGLPALLTTTGYLPDGLPVLRERIAAHYAARGLPTTAEQIIVTSGAMGALSLIARTLLTRGDRVIVESPGYPHAFDALSSVGARLSALPVGETPWAVQPLRAILRSGPHRAAYLIPDFHNPTGALMTDAERESIAGLLRRAHVTPVIDETMSGVNLDGVPMPLPFAAYDNRAVTVGSAAKTFWGGLRIGWIRAPRELVMPLIQARMSSDLGSAAFEQLVVAEILASPDEIIADALKSLRRQRAHLRAAIARELPDFELSVSPGGMSLWVTLPRRISTALVAEAARHELILTPGPRFFAHHRAAGERHLRLPYTHTTDMLDEAVSRLAAAYEQKSAHSRPHRVSGAIDLIA